MMDKQSFLAGCGLFVFLFTLFVFVIVATVVGVR